MCGRYALALPPWRVRQMLQDSNMPSDNTPDDDNARQSYNFAPGYYGLVYRQDVPDHGAAGSSQQDTSYNQEQDDQEFGTDEHPPQSSESANSVPGSQGDSRQSDAPDKTDADFPSSTPHYKLQAMAWGLTPFWTKRRPDYATIMRTINCRDDSLARSGGMWHTMKQRKRCIVLAQGFFEWLKKNEGKDKIPHYISRKDGQLMCFAGLWDSVKYEGHEDRHYSYTIITTDANKQISWLHDRMPVIFENGSDEMFTWLDATNRSEWSVELQSLLKPYKGELEIYPVTKDMNKAGTSSPNYIVPIDDSKQSISHFFGKKAQADSSSSPQKLSSQSQVPKQERSPIKQELSDTDDYNNDNNNVESKETISPEGINDETNAPLPKTPSLKRLRKDIDHDKKDDGDDDKEDDLSRSSTSKLKDEEPNTKSQKLHNKQTSSSKQPTTPMSSKRSKSATSNTAVAAAGSSNANQKITSFFKK